MAPASSARAASRVGAQRVGAGTEPAGPQSGRGAAPAATGRAMRFTGTTVLRIEGGKIVEEIGLDDGLTALQQLGLIKAV